ncbi:MAG: glycerophosphodiester phosphodiesterase [Gemmatimonadales bacterium]
MKKPLVIAHRGASGTELENSLAALRAAARDGADGVELDVHSTADGEFIVHHDGVLDSVQIPLANAADVIALRLANGEPVPTLAQGLEAIGPTLRVFVEVKTLDPRWDDAFLATLDRGPNPGNYAVHSFAFHVVHRLGIKRPGLPRGLLSEVYTRSLRQSLADAKADTLWQERATIDEALIGAVHALGARIVAWTVDDPADIARLTAWGVDGICTNYPARARHVVETTRAA